MEHENKMRIPAWLRPSTIRRMDGWLETANCKSRSEFIEKSLHFYMGYLGAKDASEYLPDELTATLQEIVTGSADRTNSLLFKCAVEQGIMAHTVAAHFGDAMEDLDCCFRRTCAGAGDSTRFLSASSVLCVYRINLRPRRSCCA